MSYALGAARRCRQTCVHVSGWSEVLAAAGARVVHAPVVQQSLAHALESKSCQCPVAASQNQHARSSVATCVTAKLAECLTARTLRGAFKQHQPSHCQPGHQQRLRQRTPPQEGCAPPRLDFAPYVAPQVRPRRRGGLGGFPPVLGDALLNNAAVRDVLRRRMRDAKKHEEGKELCSIDTLDAEWQRSRDRDGLSGSCIQLLAPNPQRTGLGHRVKRTKHVARFDIFPFFHFFTFSVFLFLVKKYHAGQNVYLPVFCFEGLISEFPKFTYPDSFPKGVIFQSGKKKSETGFILGVPFFSQVKILYFFIF